MAGLNPVPYWGLYNASKFALEGLTESLRHELKPLNISAVLVEPGFFKSNLWSNTQRGAHPIPDYEPARQRALARIRHCHESGPEPQIVAETLLKIVENPTPKLRHLLGKGVIYYRLRKWVPEARFENGVRDHWNLDGKSK